MGYNIIGGALSPVALKNWQRLRYFKWGTLFIISIFEYLSISLYLPQAVLKTLITKVVQT